MNKNIAAKLSSKLGIMQGRLSPKEIDRLQSFPHDQWRPEFARAQALGFHHLEWLVDEDGWSSNPLSRPGMAKKILALASDSGLKIKSICAHFLIDGSLLAAPERQQASEARSDLTALVNAAVEIEASDIVIPFLEKASLIEQSVGRRNLKDNLAVIPKSCFIDLETDMPAGNVLDMLAYFDDQRIGLCYDIGNASAQGYDVISDFHKLKPFVRVVHIKDRRSDGISMNLGKGDTPVLDFVQEALDSGYLGIFTLETPVFTDWATCARSNLEYLELLLK